ncbi:MAG: hypothetical protein FWF97_01865 [Alphaproteobacteria bacterium]|nr:hypothetical protein [Alphaproteobacteria bacterium]
MALEKILQGYKDIADNQALLQEEAMICAHKLNMNGLKRLHRHKSKIFFCKGLGIDCLAQDFGFPIKKSQPKGGFTASGLKEHLTMLIPKFEQDISKLKQLNYQFIQETGMECDEGVKMQEVLTKVWMKMKFRWLPRFEFTKWSPQDIMDWDKYLHDKYRCRESEHHHYEHYGMK